jgi:uncharacterized protein YndB with AHSA1/START domain
MESITIQATIKSDMQKVWDYWNKPEHITHWAFASDDWECPNATNDPVTGGKFLTRMAAKDGSFAFDLTGTYTEVVPNQTIKYVMDGEDQRGVEIYFSETEEGVRIIETFDPEAENPREMQQAGWQAILNNFKNYVENN